MTSNASPSETSSFSFGSPYVPEVKSVDDTLRPDRHSSQSFYVNPDDVVERILSAVERRQARLSTPAQVFDRSQQTIERKDAECDGGLLSRIEIHQLGLISSTPIISEKTECTDPVKKNNEQEVKVKMGWALVDPDHLSSIVSLLQAHVISAGSINLISSLSQLLEISASPSMDLKQVCGNLNFWREI